MRRCAGRARTTALNERFLGRLSADLHDGPSQDLGLALLRIEALADVCAACTVAVSKSRTVSQDFRTIQTALQSALKDLRAISAGLRLPELVGLSPAEVAERAVRDYERKTGASVALLLESLPGAVPLPLAITLYRLLQEALVNGFRHADGVGQRVRLWIGRDELCAQVSDAGSGFDPRAVQGDERLGLSGMRERAEILGGTFEVHSASGRGTVVRARLPLTLPEVLASDA